MFSGIIDEMQAGGWTKKRQAVIKSLESRLGAPVVAYIASPQHPVAQLTQQDVPMFVDMMTGASKRSKKVYLVIQSPGGDGHAAEKIIQIYRNAFPEDFAVVIPQFAKSAATMLSLGADRIVMGDVSELGPIDPQIPMTTPAGQSRLIPARAYLSAINIIRERVKNFFSGHNLPTSFHKKGKNHIFPFSKVNELSVNMNSPAALVNGDHSVRQDIFMKKFSPDKTVHSGGQFTKTKRFPDIIIRTKRQPLDHRRLIRSSAEHQDGDQPVFIANNPAQIES